MHNRRLCEHQELESIVVNLESGLKAHFLPWLQPGPPEEADRRDKTAQGPHFFNVAHERLPWCTRAPGLRVLVESPPLGYQGGRSWAALKISVALGPSYRLLSASSGADGCSQGKKRAFKTGSKLTTVACLLRALAPTAFAFAATAGDFDNRGL